MVVPKYETDDSGMDLSANIEEKIKILPGKTSIIPTGISLAVPKNFEIQIRPRSGLAAKKQITVLNTPGTIDADYRGEIKVILINLGDEVFTIEKGSRIAQMVLCPITKAVLKEVSDLDETNRGSEVLVLLELNKFMRLASSDFEKFEKHIILKCRDKWSEKDI